MKLKLEIDTGRDRANAQSAKGGNRLIIGMHWLLGTTAAVLLKIGVESAWHHFTQ